MNYTVETLMALALNYRLAGSASRDEHEEALRTALTEALAAQPVREPLTQVDCEFSAMNPLSEEVIFDLAGNYDCGMREENEKWNFTSQRQMLTFVRAIERAHGIGGDK